MLETSASSNENDEVVETVEKNVDDTCDLKEELAQVKADNAMLHERLSRALNDLETISKLNSNKKVYKLFGYFLIFLVVISIILVRII